MYRYLKVCAICLFQGDGIMVDVATGGKSKTGEQVKPDNISVWKILKCVCELMEFYNIFLEF